MGVIAEAMAAFVLADALLEKVGGDSLGEVRRNLDGYLAAIPAGLVTAPVSDAGAGEAVVSDAGESEHPAASDQHTVS